MLAKSWRPKLSFAWILVCNLGILALTICVLASCRTSSESRYSMLNIDRQLLRQTLGDECYESTKNVRPDAYRVGLSGSCRVQDGATRCQSHGPRISWVFELNKDIEAANVSESQATPLYQCVEAVNARGPDHGFTSKLAAAMFALLVISAILGVSGIVTAFFQGSGFAKPVFVIGLVDEMILVTCIGLFLGIMNHEVGRYAPSTVALRDIDSVAVLGVGFWMLVAICSARILSHPLLFLITLVVALLVVLLPFFLLFLCLGSGSREQVTVYVRTRVEHVFATDAASERRESV